MIEERTPEHEAANLPPLADDDAGPSTEFAQELEHFEHGQVATVSDLKQVAPGAKVRGRLVAIGDEQSMVEFGGRSEGLVETRHLKDDAGALKHAVGDEIELFVLEAAEQVVLAPSVKAEAGAALQQIRASQAAGIPISGKVTRKNAGGLEVDLAGVRGFCPVSQIESGFCADPSVHIGRTYDFLVTQIKDARSVVVSRRALLQKSDHESAKQLLASLKPGDEVQGTVARLETFGAFISLGGMDGLVHVSEISHDRIGHPREALTVGEKVRARVLRLDHGKDGKPRIALSIKAATADPWIEVEQRFTRGMRVTGTVVRLAEFGAFVNLAPGIDGLIHISEVASRPVAHVKEVLSPGQQIEALVLGVDPAKKRIALSLREGAGEPEAPARRPKTGETASGVVAGVKPFGVFVDLPVYGRRARGLVPREETGAPRDADLEQRFTIGDAVEVEVLDAKDDRIRLTMRSAADRAAVPPQEAPAGERAARAPRASGEPARGPRPASGSERPARGARPGGGDRSSRGERPGSGGGVDRSGRSERSGGSGAGRGDRTGRGEHSGGDRGGRGGMARESRFDPRYERPAAPVGPPEPTTMAIALRKALEKAREKSGS